MTPIKESVSPTPEVNIPSEELYKPFTPKEFTPTRMEFDFTSEEESWHRNNQGFGIHVAVLLDPKKTIHEFKYDFNYPDDLGQYEYTFNDDFLRAINGKFKRGDGRRVGGRDDKVFKVSERREEVVTELDRLKDLRKTIEEELNKLYEENNLPENIPSELKPTIGVEKKPFNASPLHDRDDEGEIISPPKKRVVTWTGISDDHSISRNNIIYSQTLLKKEAERIITDFEETGKVPDDVSEVWDERLHEIKAKYSELQIDVLNENLEKIKQEITSYKSTKGGETKVKIDIYRLEEMDDIESKDSDQETGKRIGHETGTKQEIARDDKGEQESILELKKRLINELELLTSLVRMLTELEKSKTIGFPKGVSKQVKNFSKGLDKFKSKVKEETDTKDTKDKIGTLRLSIESLFGKLVAPQTGVTSQDWINEYRGLWEELYLKIGKNDDVQEYIKDGLVTEEEITEVARKLLVDSTILNIEGEGKEINLDEVVEEALGEF